MPDTVRHPDAHRIDARGQTLAIIAMARLIGAVIESRPLGATCPLVLVGGVLAVLCGGGVRDGRATLAFTDGATGDVVIVANLLSGWLIGHARSRTPMVIGAIVGAAGYALLLRLGTRTDYLFYRAPPILMPRHGTHTLRIH